jgi:hypothetical protein
VTDWSAAPAISRVDPAVYVGRGELIRSVQRPLAAVYPMARRSHASTTAALFGPVAGQRVL